MRLKNTKTVKNFTEKNLSEEFSYYLENNTFAVLAVDSGKGNYITALTYAGPFSDMLTVINNLPVKGKYIMVEIKINSSNYKDGNVNTLFADATNEPLIINDISFRKTSWSGSDNKLLINEQKEISMSSYHVMSKIADNFLEEKNKGLL